MQIVTLLNQCYRFPGFVYQPVRCTQDRRSLQVRIRPRTGSPAICSGCHRQAPGYDHLSDRQLEFIPIWGYLVFLLYRMRRIDCKTCGVIVEAVPWADGKHRLTKAYMLFLSSSAPTRTSFRALITVALLFTALGASRQHPSSQPKNIPDSMNYMGKMVERDFTGLAEAVPEDNWRFKPPEGAFTERC
jgi:hypothetical protein